MTMES